MTKEELKQILYDKFRIKFIVEPHEITGGFTVSRKNNARLPIDLIKAIARSTYFNFSGANKRVVDFSISDWQSLISVIPEEANNNNDYCDDCGILASVLEENNLVLGEVDYRDGEIRNVCPSCKNYYKSCYNCSTPINLQFEDITTTYDGNSYCEDCQADNTFYCDGCNETYDGDDYHSPNEYDSIYCESCFNDRFRYCEACDGDYLNDETTFCEDCETTFCGSCYDSHDCGVEDLTEEQLAERNRIREEAQRRAVQEATLRNPYRPPSIEEFRSKSKGEYLTIDRLVGVEIEAEEGDIYGLGLELPKEVGISTDGSLSNRGVELQTPPASMREAERFIKESCKGLKKKGYKGTKACGLHVHIDARDIKDNHKKILQVIKTFYAVEDILFSMLPPSRWGAHYCKGLYQDYLYNNFRQKKDVKTLQKTWYKMNENASDNECDSRAGHKYDNTRYFGLNIHSVFYRGTIELRYHSGTVNEHKILQWVKFMTILVNWAIKHYDEKQIKYLFDMPTSIDKMQFMFNMLGFRYNRNNDLRRYIEQRTDKFNKNFLIKFNKGKLERENEQNNLLSLKRKVNKQIKERYERTLKNLIQNYKEIEARDRMYKFFEEQDARTNTNNPENNPAVSFRSIEYITSSGVAIGSSNRHSQEEMREEMKRQYEKIKISKKTQKQFEAQAKNEARSIIMSELPRKDYILLHHETGFVKDEELNQAKALLEQGRQIQTAIQNGEEVEE